MRTNPIALASILTGTAFSPPAQTLDSLAPPTHHRTFTLAPASAETGGGQPDTERLAKAVQDLVASLISVPIQNNWDLGIGPVNARHHTANIQLRFAPTLLLPK
jgi:hypothetical protein